MYIDNSENGESPNKFIHIQSGRPIIDNFLKDITSNPSEDSSSKNICLLICGPKALTDEAIIFAINHGIDFHVETFGY